MTLSDLDALMAGRYSCRAFRPDPVPREVIERIISTARRVPSWCNAQPWELTVTSGRETDALRAGLQEAAEAAPPEPDLPFPNSYSGVYQERRRACGWALYDAVGVEKGDRAGAARQSMQNFALFGAPHCAILSTPVELGAYGALDAGGFVTAFTLAARAEGVDTIPQAAVATCAPFLHRHLGIGEDRLILCGLTFGYGDPDHPANSFRTKRAGLDEFVQWRG